MSPGGLPQQNTTGQVASTIAVYSLTVLGLESESEVPIRLVSGGSCLLGLQMAALCLGEGNGTPLQSSCLENPMDGGAW